MARKDDISKVKEELNKVDKSSIKGQDFSSSHEVEFKSPKVKSKGSSSSVLSEQEARSLSGLDNKQGGLETIPFPKKNDMVINQLDKMAMETQVVPLSNSETHPTMDADVFNGLVRTPKVNNKILIMVRHKSSPLPSYETMADLTYYDEESRTIVNSNAIPNFYKQLYKNIYGRKDYIFYCNIRDLDSIKKMLKRDKDIMKESRKILDDFLSDI